MPPTTAPRQYGHQHRRDGERRAEVAPVPGAEHRLAEREAGSSQHDAEGGEGQRDEQRQGDRGVGLREAGPQHDEHEDQPDVVGLPHRGDRVVDDLAGSFAALGPAGDEVPEAGTEVGAAEDRVHRDRDEQHDGGGRCSSSRRLPSSPLGWVRRSGVARP